jgi:hypothetical protein
MYCKILHGWLGKTITWAFYVEYVTLYHESDIIWVIDTYNRLMCIPTRGNLYLPVRLLVWADGPPVEQADSATRAELQGAPKQKLMQLKYIQKYHWVKHREMLICCLDVFHDMLLLWM